ncbi:MAG: MBL fold metallo-hydrolase [Candidatus Latescibacteria bacterium]|nr:MBL fold metallo-hydrolase [Candidatus Latescibacterota bacterium]
MRLSKKKNILQNNDISPSHHTKNGFSNPNPDYEQSTISRDMKRVLFDRRKAQKKIRRLSYTMESVENDGSYLRSNYEEFTVTWAGHSTVLVQIEGQNILLDPIWSNRASPVPFAGPKRYIKPGIDIENLPEIHCVLLSHNHYDHFDKSTIKRLKNSELFIVPLGFGKELRRIGIINYIELDWWERVTHNDIGFVCTPSQHNSTRRLIDHDKTLWCSWIIQGKRNNLFFAGDTGYFPGFKEIGSRFGPFNIVCLPIGAYLPRKYLEHVHMSPKDALHAYHDLQGTIFLAIHWGTFNLGNDPPDMAPKVLKEEIKKMNLDEDLFWILKHGETRIIKDSSPIT